MLHFSGNLVDAKTPGAAWVGQHRIDRPELDGAVTPAPRRI
jgi:hypothetical protein